MALKWKTVGYAAAALGAGFVMQAAADRMFIRYPSVYYQLRSPRLLADFEAAIDSVRPLMMQKFGSAKAAQYRSEARAEYRRILPHYPYIGASNQLEFFLITAGWMLALYRALKRHGYLVEEVGELVTEFADKYVQQAPPLARRLIRDLTYTPINRMRLQIVARESQKKRYPGDFEVTFVPGDGKTFDFGLDYTECAIVKFLQAENAAELAPYMCAVDRVLGNAFGVGLIRTTTIAEGAVYCDFRFKQGAQTVVDSTVLPPDAPHLQLDPHPELFEE